MSLSKNKDFCHLSIFFSQNRNKSHFSSVTTCFLCLSFFFFFKMSISHAKFYKCINIQVLYRIFLTRGTPHSSYLQLLKNYMPQWWLSSFWKKLATAWASCWSKIHMILASVSQSAEFLLDSHCDEANNSNRETSSGRKKNCLWPVTGRFGKKCCFPEQCS